VSQAGLHFCGHALIDLGRSKGLWQSSKFHQLLLTKKNIYVFFALKYKTMPLEHVISITFANFFWLLSGRKELALASNWQ
jgi:hypothetical protein